MNVMSSPGPEARKFMVFTTLNQVGLDKYVLRDKMDKTKFLHYIGIGEDGIGLYTLREGTLGAGVWSKEMIDLLKDRGDIDGFDAVRCVDAMPNDGSLN